MKQDAFEKIVAEQMEHCTDILVVKAREYAGDGDRLHNFKVAAALEGCTPRKALAGMLAKHTVSVFDMCQTDKEYSMEQWTEKITDHMNYLLLLKALITEETWPKTIVYADGKPYSFEPLMPDSGK